MAAQSNESPVIIYGSVRSGTTMFRLMMGAHPDLVEVGENEFLVDCLRNDGRDPLQYDIDRLEADRVFRMRNLSCGEGLDGADLVTSLVEQMKAGRQGPVVVTFHASIDRIERIFPNARYIHICRDPRDVTSSIAGFGWEGNVYYAANFWLACEKSWEVFKRRAAPGRCAEVRYEDLVLEPEENLQRLCEFLGIAFTPAMLNYSRSSTYSKPDATLLQRWKKTGTARQIALVEAKCGTLMEQRGYSLASGSIKSIGPLEKGHLAVDNKMRKVLKAISFFGFRDYGLEKIYRLPGFSRQRADVVRRMQETTNRSLK